MKAIITQASNPKYWYAKRIGEAFLVVPMKVERPPFKYVTEVHYSFGRREQAIDGRDLQIIEP